MSSVEASQLFANPTPPEEEIPKSKHHLDRKRRGSFSGKNAHSILDTDNRTSTLSNNTLRRIARNTDLPFEFKVVDPGEKLDIHPESNSQAAKKTQSLADCLHIDNEKKADKTNNIQHVSSQLPRKEFINKLYEFWALLIDDAQKIDPLASCYQWMQTCSQTLCFGAPDLEQLKEPTTGNFTSREESKQNYLAWLEMCNHLEQSSEQTVAQRLAKCAKMVSPTGQPLAHLMLANFDIVALHAVKSFVPEALNALNGQYQDAFEFCQSLPLCERNQKIEIENGVVMSPREWKNQLTPRTILESPRLSAAAHSRSSSVKITKSSFLRQAVKLSIQEIFDQFHTWNEKEQKTYLEYAGMDHLILNGKTMVMEMIQSGHWDAATRLVRYGCEVNLAVVDTYRSVRSNNPDFKEDVLDRAWEISKLHLFLKKGLNDKPQLLTCIDIYQGDFTADVKVGQSFIPLCNHLLLLDDEDINRCTSNRMKQLNQLAVVNTSEL